MNILITAGTTRVFIDRVRCITNIFSGRTGTAIALEALRRGHTVTLLTSNPGLAREQAAMGAISAERWRVIPFDTIDDLRLELANRLQSEAFDVVLHSAAVSDYVTGGIFAPAAGTRFTEKFDWHAESGVPPTFIDRGAGKVKSDEGELWLRLLRAPKLVDMVRPQWGFRGLLVKFKLEVDIGDDKLLQIAEKSRVHSGADLMVANTLEGAAAWAYVGPLAGAYVKIARADLPAKLIEAVEGLR